MQFSPLWLVPSSYPRCKSISAFSLVRSVVTFRRVAFRTRAIRIIMRRAPLVPKDIAKEESRRNGESLPDFYPWRWLYRRHWHAIVDKIGLFELFNFVIVTLDQNQMHLMFTRVARISSIPLNSFSLRETRKYPRISERPVKSGIDGEFLIDSGNRFFSYI